MQKFYAKNGGWHPHPSSHITLLPVKDRGNMRRFPDSVPIHKDDLEELCKKDEALIKDSASKLAQSSSKTIVALLPSVEVMEWHHAREEFVSQEVLGRQPKIKGAYAKTSNGQRIWCIWTHMFGENESDNTLYILRIAIESEDETHAAVGDESSEDRNAHEGQVLGVAACLRAAQQDAAQWNMKSVKTWNPSRTVVAAALRLDPSVKVTDRQEESITCLLWYGSDEGRGGIEWIGNEKFGWS